MAIVPTSRANGRTTMHQIILDTSATSKLASLREEAQLCDQAGSTLGHFLPASLYRDMLTAWSKSVIDESELERRLNEPGGRVLAEIWKRLGRS
jgi:hypothetical protein